MEGRVRQARGKQATQRDDATARCLSLRLDDETRCTHAHDHTVPTRIEGQRSIFHLSCGCRRARGEESRTDPLDEVLPGHIVGTDHHHALAPTQLNPVRRHGDRLSRARTCCIRLCVWTLGTDVLRKLGVTHAQDLEQESAIEVPFAEVTVSADELSKLVIPGERRRKDDARVRPHLLW